MDFHQPKWRTAGSRPHSRPWQSSQRSYPVTAKPIALPTALGSEIKQLSAADLDTSTRLESAKITGLQHLASYNLLEGLDREILSPGRPARWQPLQHAFTLKKDRGDYPRDQNAVHFPKCPLDPAVQSIIAAHPDLDTSLIDVVACAGTLASLLKFADYKPAPFSFIVHSIGTSVFFLRRGLTANDIIPDVKGYGHNFIDENTTWEEVCKGSVSHQRVVTYKLGEMKIALRFEADCYLRDADDEAKDSTAGAESDKDDVSVEAMLVASSISGQSMTKRSSDLPVVVAGGAVVEHSKLVEIKTKRSDADRAEFLSKEFHRFWLRQIPNLVLAFHHFGSFEVPVVESIVEDVQRWEEDKKDMIARLVATMAEIREAARGGKALEVRCEDGSSKLQIRVLSEQEASERPAVSEGTKQRWCKMMQGECDVEC